MWSAVAEDAGSSDSGLPQPRGVGVGPLPVAVRVWTQTHHSDVSRPRAEEDSWAARGHTEPVRLLQSDRGTPRARPEWAAGGRRYKHFVVCCFCLLVNLESVTLWNRPFISCTDPSPLKVVLNINRSKIKTSTWDLLIRTFGF